MKKFYFIILFLISFLFYSNNSFSQFLLKHAYFSGNNICNYFSNFGVFNNNYPYNGYLIWPCGSYNAYVYITGLSAACKIDNHLAMFACSYRGELYPGYVSNLNAITNSDFKIYSVKAGDNASTNPDYANWYKMVPYGAPYTDVNKNGTFDIGIDKPGIPDASQTIFMCLTDAFTEMKSPGEGFGGGITNPLLYAELHFTAWGYTTSPLYDVQFIKYEIINKGNKNWDSLRFGLFDDPDISSAYSNYFGCDTSRNLGFVYNGDSIITGAYGLSVLKGLVNKTTGEKLNFSSCIQQIKYFSCEGIPDYSDEAYLQMKGLKFDGSSFYDPTQDPPAPTKFIFSGDPETGTGWVPSKGYLEGCNGYDTIFRSLGSGDAKFVLGLGADNFSMAPGDTQNIYFAQMLAQGNTNENSVTKVKSLADRVKAIFDNQIYNQVSNINGMISVPVPGDFYLSQNYPNPFNITTNINYGVPRVSDVKLDVFDVTGRKITTLINSEIQPGEYNISWNATGIASGVYIYRMEVVDKTVSSAKRYSNIKKMVLIK